ncbi:MAG: tetratricopeptide repeat protein [Spirochaetes bacterium]|nr:tetratricopeptide repeat protein [Spirochaetota bacterium]
MEKRNIQIERNIIEASLMSAKDVFKRYKKIIAYSIIALISIFFVFIGSYLYYEHRTRREMVKFEEIMEKYRALVKSKDVSPITVSMTIDQMRTLVDSSQWGFVNRMGNYILGGMYFNNQNYSEARRRYVEFAEENPKSDFSILALQKAAVAAEYIGDYDDAFRLYKKLEENFGNTEFGDQIYYDCARMYQKKGDLFKAREYFRKVITSHPRSIFSLRARHRLFLLSYQEKNLK